MILIDVDDRTRTSTEVNPSSYSPAKDFVEVVRCKNCRYWEEPNEYGFADCTKNYGLGWGANQFCSMGEKKE